MCFLYIFLGGGRNFICLPEAQSWPGTALYIYTAGQKFPDT